MNAVLSYLSPITSQAEYAGHLYFLFCTLPGSHFCPFFLGGGHQYAGVLNLFFFFKVIIQNQKQEIKICFHRLIPHYSFLRLTKRWRIKQKI